MEDGGEFEIKIGKEGAFKRSYLEGNESHARSLYKYAKLNDVIPLCMCMPGGVSMQIAHMSKHDNYVLKRNPKSGNNHHQSCWSYGDPQQGKQTTDYIEALLSNNDGSLDIKIDVSITFADIALTPQPSSPTPRSNSNQRKATTLIGLFEYIWETAGLMKWEPDNRRPNYKSIREKISKCLDDNTSCNNQLLKEILFIPYYEKWSEFSKLLMDRTSFTIDSGAKRRIIVIGLVNSLSEAKYGKTLKLYTVDKSIYFYINKPSTINRLTKILPCEDGEYKFGRSNSELFWFVGTAFPKIKQDNSGFVTSIDEGVVVPVSNEHVPKNINIA